MSLHLKLKLNFPQNLVFKGFLPEKDADYLNLDYKGHRITIHLSDRKEQLSNVGSLPTDPEQLKRRLNINCNSLTMEIEVIQPDPDVVAALEAEKPTDKTERFGQEISNLILEIHNMLVSYFRNILKQFWIEYLTMDPVNYQEFLDQHNTYWLDANGKWRPFFVVRQYTKRIMAIVYGNGVNRDMWTSVKPFLEEKNGKPPLRDILIANSLQHLSERNGRIAVLEAVIAFESTLKEIVPKMILNLPGDPQIKKGDLVKVVDDIMKDTGLKLATKVILSIIKDSVGLENDDIETVVDAIDTRNRIIHRSQRTVDISSARKYVKTIQKVVEGIENLNNNLSC